MNICPLNRLALSGMRGGLRYLQMDSIELNSTVEVPAETLAVLTEISQEINSSLNLDEVLASAAAQVKRLIDFEIFSLLLIDESANNLYFRFAIGHRLEVVEHWRIPLGDGIIGTAAATGQAIRVGDVSKDSRYLPAVESVRSELAVPMIVRGRVIGVMDIESRQLDYFTPAQQNILTLVASRIGTAIENAQLYENAQKQAETLLLLNEIGREANSTLQVEEVLRRAVELTKRLIDYQIFSILLLDEVEGVFRHRVTVKFGQRDSGKVRRPGARGHHWRGGVFAEARRRAGRVPRSALPHGQSRDAFRACGADDFQESGGRRDGPRKSAAKLFHPRPCAGALDSCRAPGGFHRECPPL